MSNEELYREIALLPDELKGEVVDFVAFLKMRYEKKQQKLQRQFGAAKGFFEMADDFDAPLENFKEYS